MVSGPHSTSSASAVFGGVFPASSWQALASRPREQGLQRPRVASRKHSRCEALVQKGLVVFLVGAHCRLISNLSVRFSWSPIVGSFFLVSHRLAHDACRLWLLIDCNFPLEIVGRRDSQTYTSCSSGLCRRETENCLKRLPTHPELRVEVHCRKPFLRRLKPSGRVSIPFWTLLSCVPSVSFMLHCWVAADLDTCFGTSGFGGCGAGCQSWVSSLDYLLHAIS